MQTENRQTFRVVVNRKLHKIYRSLNINFSNPGMAIGHDVFDYLQYDGTFYISDNVRQDEETDSDYAGFVFGYQNNRYTYLYYKLLPT